MSRYYVGRDHKSTMSARGVVHQGAATGGEGESQEGLRCRRADCARHRYRIRGRPARRVDAPRLELLVDAGLTPQDALRAATINAARMIGREQDRGTVEAGKLADLVILEANPLQDIRNVSRIYRTVKGGVLLPPAAPAQRR